VRVVYEPTLLETGGGLLNALSHFDVSEPILTVNSDAWFCDQSSRCFETLASAWHKNMDALLLLVHKNNAVGYEGRGDYYMENTCLRYRYGAETPPFVYAGAQVIQPSSFLSFQPEGPIFSMKSVWDFLELQKKLHGVEYGGKWCDVGTHKALHEVQSGGQLLHRP
jgi:MurNAc alpha-1-phosphate uridylyltransferase